MAQDVTWTPHRCGAKLRRREARCQQWAMRGQERCRLHGGLHPKAIAKAAERHTRARAERLVVAYGLPVEISPAEALLEEVHRTAGHVRWLGDIIRSFEDHNTLVWGLIEQTSRASPSEEMSWDESKFGAVTNAWLRLYRDERKHLVDVATKVQGLGLYEAQVRLQTIQLTMLEGVLRAVVERLGHDYADPAVRGLVVAELTAARDRAVVIDVTPARRVGT